MSVKHIKKYYNDIAIQFMEMQEVLREAENNYSQKLVSPEQLENIKKTVEPLKQNYARISYIMYLLNMPAKNKKKNKYAKTYEKFYKSIANGNTLSDIKQENSNAINKIKELANE